MAEELAFDKLNRIREEQLIGEKQMEDYVLANIDMILNQYATHVFDDWISSLKAKLLGTRDTEVFKKNYIDLNVDTTRKYFCQILGLPKDSKVFDLIAHNRKMCTVLCYSMDAECALPWVVDLRDLFKMAADQKLIFPNKIYNEGYYLGPIRNYVLLGVNLLSKTDTPSPNTIPKRSKR